MLRRLALTTSILLLASGFGAGAAALAGTNTGTTTDSTTTPSTTTTTTKVSALRVLSATPNHIAAGYATVTIQFSTALPKTVSSRELPRLSPGLAGKWSEVGTSELRFTPSSVYPAGTTVKVTVPVSLKAVDGAHLSKPYTFSYQVGNYQQTRLVQLLAQLHYLPLKFIPAAKDKHLVSGNVQEQRRLAFAAPSGRFTWNKGWPSQLHSLWAHDRGAVLAGAIRTVEYQHHLTMDGVADAQVWSDLLSAAAGKHANTRGYTYAVATETDPETLTIWHNGHVVLHSPANTGIAAAPTAPGTYPVYEKLSSQVMRGKNPDGSKYADQVYWVSYFHGGDAVHYFDRSTYGWPQSLGCVEVPMAAARTSFGYLTYGTLVTVTG
jgi:hypothetical protein